MTRAKIFLIANDPFDYSPPLGGENDVPFHIQPSATFAVRIMVKPAGAGWTLPRIGFTTATTTFAELTMAYCIAVTS
jgi:hypothetical protein